MHMCDSDMTHSCECLRRDWLFFCNGVNLTIVFSLYVKRTYSFRQPYSESDFCGAPTWNQTVHRNKSLITIVKCKNKISTVWVTHMNLSYVTLITGIPYVNHSTIPQLEKKKKYGGTVTVRRISLGPSPMCDSVGFCKLWNKERKERKGLHKEMLLESLWKVRESAFF